MQSPERRLHMPRWATGRLPQGLPRDVFVMAGVGLCVALGFGVVAPAIPLFAEQFGVSATAAGAVVSVFALTKFAFGLPAGRLTDKIGERTGLMLGLAVVGISSLLAGLSQSYTQLVVLRGVGGIGSALFGVGAMGLVLRVAGKRMRGRAVSIYRSGFLIGGITGPALGGAVLGLSLRAPFFLYAGTLAAATAVAFGLLSKPGRQEDSRSEADEQPEEPADQAPDPTMRTLLRTPQYQTALVANLAVGLAVLGVRSTAVPLLIDHSLGVPLVWVGVSLATAAVVQTVLMFPAGRWTDSRGRRFGIMMGAIITAAGLVLLAIGGSLTLVLIAMGVFGAGSAFLGSAPGALVGDVVGKRSGTTVAVFNMANDLGKVVGPTLAGVLIDAGSFPAAFAMAAAVVLLVGVVGLRLPAGAPQAPDEAAGK